MEVENDSCAAQRGELKAVDDYFNQSLIEGTAIGAAAGGLTGALAGYLVRHDAGDMVIGATAGMITGGVGGYFAARSQAISDRDALVKTVYDDVTKENVQVNRATAAFTNLRDCRLAAANAIKRSYREGTLREADARAQLSRERQLFDQDIAYAERIGAQMQKRNAEFMNAATELDKRDDVVVASREKPAPASSSRSKKVATKKKTKAPPPPTATSRVMTVAESSQDSVQAYNGNIEAAKAESGSSFDLAALDGRGHYHAMLLISPIVGRRQKPVVQA
ncbi:MAG: hypothetical protein IPK66_18350 [Rhodospirillales bacterium]|nr:hypothetical protein [Rhodospirillales bacterium]